MNNLPMQLKNVLSEKEKEKNALGIFSLSI